MKAGSGFEHIRGDAPIFGARRMAFGLPAPDGSRFALTAGAGQVGKIVRFDGIFYRVAEVVVEPDGSAMVFTIQRIDA